MSFFSPPSLVRMKRRAQARKEKQPTPRFPTGIRPSARSSTCPFHPSVPGDEEGLPPDFVHGEHGDDLAHELEHRHRDVALCVCVCLG